MIKPPVAAVGPRWDARSVRCVCRVWRAPAAADDGGSERPVVGGIVQTTVSRSLRLQSWRDLAMPLYIRRLRPLRLMAPSEYPHIHTHTQPTRRRHITHCYNTLYHTQYCYYYLLLLLLLFLQLLDTIATTTALANNHYSPSACSSGEFT